uniref:Post-GPI attachment to proteins factor 3 n=1 Tax=Brassica oleracea var. oleracea TaxID=109376 RepID=A0A0D3A541_BRAOL
MNLQNLCWLIFFIKRSLLLDFPRFWNSKNIKEHGEFKGTTLLRFKIDDSDLKNKGGKPTVRVSNVGHALHVWLNGECHASGLAMLLEIYDFPPYGGYFDAHSIWHATVPLTILWWSFIRDDAEFRTSSLLKKSKTKAK